ncbi:hypothetical protein [Hydrogenophaga sp. T2]|uniref:hypothetical protein n=1 Tax=Hydrogenophaga sp. T2 TaxID=3132823 RepID=UPI003CF74696
MGSSAVTLGRHSGVALIGRPLDVRLQVMLAPGEDIGTQCVAAEVFYGDVLVPSNLVTVTTSIAAGETTGTARVVSSQPINEPIVTLSVRAGCGLPFTRRYVLLADPVSEPASTQALPAPAVIAPAPAPLPVPAPQAAPAAAAVPAPPPTATPAPAPAPVVRARPPAPPKPPKVAVAPRPKQSAPAPAPAPKAANAPAGAAAAPATGGSPRLRLDPPDLPASGAGSPGGQAPAGSAAGSPAEPNALETALAAANAEVARNNERLAALEAEMARFREAQQRDQARVAELTAQLARAEEDRYSNWVVFLLGGLLALALAAIAVLMRRQRRETALASDASRAWWAEQPADEADEPPTRASRRAALEPSAPVPLDEIDVDVDSAPVPLPPPAMPRKAASDSLPPIDRREFAPSAMGVSRSVATEELFDVQQQADFFVSLGEDEQAIAVLRNHLAESHEPSPLAYLDLFRLYHRLGRREDYDALREEFNTVFNAGAPQFDRYSDKGRGLEAYETAFARIQALWPQPRVLDLIERSIFRDSQEGETEVFDLEAYRELLMLHAIAKELVERDAGSTQPPRDFQNTNMQPLKAAGKAEAASASAGAGEETQRRNVTVPMDLHVIPPASPRVALDVNIEELEIESQFEASLPEVDVPVEPTAGRSRAFREGESMIDFEILDNIPPVQRRDSDRNGGSGDDPAR